MKYWSINTARVVQPNTIVTFLVRTYFWETLTKKHKCSNSSFSLIIFDVLPIILSNVFFRMYQ